MRNLLINLLRVDAFFIFELGIHFIFAVLLPYIPNALGLFHIFLLALNLLVLTFVLFFRLFSIFQF